MAKIENGDRLRSMPPEDLHNLAASTASPTSPAFVNPGTPNAPLVSEADRKTGQIAPSATDKLRSRLMDDTVNMAENY